MLVSGRVDGWILLERVPEAYYAGRFFFVLSGECIFVIMMGGEV